MRAGRAAHIAAAARWPRLLPGRAVRGRGLRGLLTINDALYVLCPLQVLLELRAEQGAQRQAAQLLPEQVPPRPTQRKLTRPAAQVVSSGRPEPQAGAQPKAVGAPWQ